MILSLTLRSGSVATLSAWARGAPGILALAGAAVVLGAALYAWERRHTHPVVDFRLFRHPAFVGAWVAVLLTNLVMYTTLLLVPLFLAGVQGRGPREVGGVLVTYSGVMSALSPVGGLVSDRLGRAVPVIGGSVLLLAGTGLLLQADAGTSLLGLIALLAIGAAGVGLQMGAEQSAALESAPAEMSGVAGGLWATRALPGGDPGHPRAQRRRRGGARPRRIPAGPLRRGRGRPGAASGWDPAPLLGRPSACWPSQARPHPT